jgi:hypothetical protein
MIWLAWLLTWSRIIAPPPPAPRWTPATWERRCIGRAYQRHKNGYLPLEQALTMIAAIHTEHRAGVLEAGVLSQGSLVGVYVPAVLSLRLLIETPSLVEENR